jgi:heat shock protein HslJ
MRLLRMAVLAVFAFAFASPAQAQPSKPQQPVPAPKPTQEKIFPLGTTWVAVSLNGRSYSGDRPSFTLNKQYRATGFGGCNNYSATAYPLREQNLAVGPFALTKKSCPANAMAVERAFLVALRSSQRWDQQGSTLTIQTENGELRFERAL